MKKRFLPVLLLVLVAAYIFPLGLRPLFQPDEIRYAEIPREMIANGDWVVPHLNGFRYFEKPAMGYWAIALSMKVFGQNAFAVRLPMALAALLIAFALFMFVRKFLEGKHAAILTAIVFLTMGGIYAIGTFCVLDMLLALFFTASMIFFFFAYVEQNVAKKSLFLALFGACCGAAFLIKGFLAFAVPCIVIGPFLLWERRPGQLLRLPWIPILASILVALPWAFLIHKREPDFWRYFFWEEHVRRFMGEGAQHPKPFWYYVPMIFSLIMPWTLFVWSAAVGLRIKGFKSTLIRFVVCWTVFPFLFFSFSKGKLGTYILPCLPPLAVLIVLGFLVYFDTGKKKLFDVTARILSWCLAGAAVAFGVYQFANLGPALYGPGEGWKVGIIVAVVIGWAVILRFVAREKDNVRRILYIAAGPCLLFLVVQAILPGLVLERAAPGIFLARNAERINASDTVVFTQRALVQSVCWQFKRNDIHLLGLSSEFRYGATYDDTVGRVTELEDFRDFVAHASPDTVVTLVIYARYYPRYRDKLPTPIFEDSSQTFVITQYRGGDFSQPIESPVILTQSNSHAEDQP